MHSFTAQPGNRRRSRIARRDRRGMALSIELVVALPILLVVLVAVVEFSLLLFSLQGVSNAANLGARVAALPSSSKADVDAAVAAAVGTFNWSSLQEVVVFVDGVKDTTAAPGVGPLFTATTGAEISVSVNLDADQAAPDILGMVGIPLFGKQLTATFFTRKE